VVGVVVVVTLCVVVGVVAVRGVTGVGTSDAAPGVVRGGEPVPPQAASKAAAKAAG
jgi:L-asparaginase/Glu-tRNA(Gln) amidotransferase subunit D